MNPATTVTLHRHGRGEAIQMRDVLVPIYAATHAHLLHLPWYPPDEWWTRLTDLYAITPDFTLVTAQMGGSVLGYAFGSPNNSDKHWSSIRARFPDMPGSGPVYIFREFAVHPDHQRHGYGRQIHDELLAGRPEPVGHLLVRQDNNTARTAYERWGWVHIGEVQPFPEAPLCDAMALDLRPRR